MSTAASVAATSLAAVQRELHDEGQRIESEIREVVRQLEGIIVTPDRGLDESYVPKDPEDDIKDIRSLLKRLNASLERDMLNLSIEFGKKYTQTLMEEERHQRSEHVLELRPQDLTEVDSKLIDAVTQLVRSPQHDSQSYIDFHAKLNQELLQTMLLLANENAAMYRLMRSADLNIPGLQTVCDSLTTTERVKTRTKLLTHLTQSLIQRLNQNSVDLVADAQFSQSNMARNISPEVENEYMKNTMQMNSRKNYHTLSDPDKAAPIAAQLNDMITEWYSIVDGLNDVQQCTSKQRLRGHANREHQKFRKTIFPRLLRLERTLRGMLREYDEMYGSEFMVNGKPFELIMDQNIRERNYGSLLI
eukprot:Clim_evm15s164 gene=Clim_evmTU15s164